MSKARSDSVLEGLPGNQKEALESWLCDENISYLAALERLRLDFNVRSSESALKRFYQRCEQRRMKERIFKNQGLANEVTGEFRKTGQDYSEPLLRLIGQMAFEQAMNGRELDPKFFVQLSTLLLTAKGDGIKNQLKAEQLKLNREKFEFDAAKACLKKLPELKVIGADNSLDEDAKIRAVREKIFGRLPEDIPSRG